MFICGEFKEIDYSSNSLEKLIGSLKHNDYNVLLDEIIDVLDSLKLLWSPGSKYFSKAMESLSKSLSFSPKMIEETLKIIPSLLDRENLYERFSSELGNPNAIDKPVSTPSESRYLLSPVGCVLHVTAGNVFISAIDSLIMGLITKNITFLKVSSSNTDFPQIFLKSLCEVDTKQVLTSRIVCLSWKGGDLNIENLFKKHMDLIIAWGGEEMVESYKKNLPLDTKLIDYGPKISIGVIDQAYIDSNPEIYTKIARDVCLWDQAACANLQNLYVDENTDINQLISNLSIAFSQYSIPRGKLEADEYVEVLKEKSKASFSSFSNNINFASGDDYHIRFDSNNILSTTALNRSLVIKRYKSINELSLMLANFSFYLQTCSLGISKNMNNTLLKLSRAGIKRFTEPGAMLEGVNGASHDGHYPLQNFVNNISIEFEPSLDEFNSWPQIKSDSSVYFATGGTTGDPKFTQYSNDEFDYISTLLANSYKLRELPRGCVVANLFAAGNMWSSFIAVYKALEKMSVQQLPIGATNNHQDIINFFKRFQPKVVFAIPSYLYDLSVKFKPGDVQIDTVFYAGEGLSDYQKEALVDKFKVKNFFSAGYACVDIGLIGYQDNTCLEGEHILFKGMHMDIIDDIAHISSTLKSIDKISNYSTGDIVELKGNRKFLLKGRKSPLINIWGARLLVSQIEKALSECGYEDDFQTIITREEEGVEVLEIRTLRKINVSDFYKHLLIHAVDIRQSIGNMELNDTIKLTTNNFEHNSRTGKTARSIDKR